ncbi:MAG: hypothetical protein ACOCRX_03130 [Candidatus Woesearchaeota archaeon]
MILETIYGIGIDRGFATTIFSSNEVEGIIDSLVAPLSKEQAEEIINNNKDDKDVILIKEEDNYYLCGSYVAEVKPSYAERDLRRSRETSSNERILFMAAMALGTKNVTEAKLVVTTGLPTDDFKKDKETYKNLILNNKKPYEFSLFKCGKEYKKKISVVYANIENQPKGTVIVSINEKLKNKENWRDIKTQKIAISDFGFNTLDNSVYVGKDIVDDDKINFSTQSMAQVAALTKKYIETELKTTKTENEVLKAIETGKVKIRGKYEDCKPQVVKAFTESVRSYLNEIASKWDSIVDSFDEWIINGGPLEDENFTEILKEQYSKILNWEVTIPKHPQKTNARGFNIISQGIVQKMAKSV